MHTRGYELPTLSTVSGWLHQSWFVEAIGHPLGIVVAARLRLVRGGCRSVGCVGVRPSEGLSPRPTPGVLRSLRPNSDGPLARSVPGILRYLAKVAGSKVVPALVTGSDTSR
jgi:hypothetical protein